MSRLPDLPSWVGHPRTAWFIIEGLVLAVFGLGLTLVGPSIAPPVVTLGELAILAGLLTAAAGAVVYGLLMIRADFT
ncbi:MAG: hypothetical protein R3324_06215 [Halobacteriales archaeon]|nr:hypothetical protein [Halobacteriales archaeon]